MADQSEHFGNRVLSRARKEPQGVQKMLYFFILFLALVTIFFSGVPFLSRQSVQVTLNRLSTSFASYARESGGEATLTHGEVDVVGLAYEKKARVKDVTLEVLHSPWLGSNKVTISTPEVLFVPDVGGSGKYVLEFPAPLAVAFNGIPMYNVTFVGGPATYLFGQNKTKEGEEITNALLLPKALRVVPVAGGEAKAFDITYNASPQVICRHIPSSGRSQTTLAFSNVSVSGARNFTVRSFNALLMREPVPGDKLSFDSDITVDKVDVKGEHGVEGPYSFKLSAGGTRIAPGPGVLPPPDTDVTLRDFSFSMANFLLSAQGSLSRKADDSLPYGNAEVKVQNFYALRSNPNLSPEIKAALVGMASRIAGLDASTADNFNFTIRRDKLGTLAIGHTTLADVTTTLLAQFMIGGGQPAVAAAPVPAEPLTPPGTTSAKASVTAGTPPKVTKPVLNPEKLAPASGTPAH